MNRLLNFAATTIVALVFVAPFAEAAVCNITSFGLTVGGANQPPPTLAPNTLCSETVSGSVSFSSGSATINMSDGVIKSTLVNTGGADATVKGNVTSTIAATLPVSFFGLWGGKGTIGGITYDLTQVSLLLSGHANVTLTNPSQANLANVTYDTNTNITDVFT